MSRLRRCRGSIALVVMMLLGCLQIKEAVAQANAAERLQLEIFINGHSTNLIAQVVRRADARLAMSEQELRDVGIRPDRTARDDDGLYDLERLPQSHVRYDEPAQILHFILPDTMLLPRNFDAGQARLRGSIEPATRETTPGAVLNYSAYANSNVGSGDFFDAVTRQTAANVTLDGRIFSEYGILSQSGIVGVTPFGGRKSLRLDTTYSFSDPDKLLIYRAGDLISGGLSWTRPVRLGGIQMQRSFSLRPDLVTMPLPSLSGSAAVPSTVDVFVNNVKTYSRQVPAGPFVISDIPVVSGAGTQRLVVRDAAGRETSTSSTFYAAPTLLRKGLYDFSVEAGFRRYSYGIESADYDRSPVGSASSRVGLSDALTLESHVEGGAGLVNGGLGGTTPIGSFAAASAAFAGSYYGGQSGLQTTLTLEASIGGVKLFGKAQRAFADYLDLAAIAPTVGASTTGNQLSYLPPRELYQAALSVPLPKSAVTLSYTQLLQATDDRQAIVGLSYSRSLFGSATLFASAYRDFGSQKNTGFLAGISISLSPDISMRGDISSAGNRTSGGIDISKVQRSTPGTYGWRIRDREGSVTDRSASASYRFDAGRAAAGVQQFRGGTSLSGEFEGGIAVAAGGVYFANRLDDAFAIVDAGSPDVEVYQDNRIAGRTDKRGRLLVPGLRPHDRNQISIDPTNVPVSTAIARTRVIKTPKERGAVLVDFGVEPAAHSTLVTLRDGSGRYLPVGSRATSAETQQSYEIGYEGQVYITSETRSINLAVDMPDGRHCQARLPIQLQVAPSGISKLDGVCL